MRGQAPKFRRGEERQSEGVDEEIDIEQRGGDLPSVQRREGSSASSGLDWSDVHIKFPPSRGFGRGRGVVQGVEGGCHARSLVP